MKLATVRSFALNMGIVTDILSATFLELARMEVHRGGQRLHQLGIRKRFIRSLSGVDRCSLSW